MKLCPPTALSLRCRLTKRERSDAQNESEIDVSIHSIKFNAVGKWHRSEAIRCQPYRASGATTPSAKTPLKARADGWHSKTRLD
jgi:hypothetical protein